MIKKLMQTTLIIFKNIEKLLKNKKLIGLDVGAQGGFNSDKFFPEKYNKYFESILVDPLKNSLENKKVNMLLIKVFLSSKWNNAKKTLYFK